MKARVILTTVVFMLLVPTALCAAPLAERSVLDNGIILLHAERVNLPIVTVVVSIDAGGVREQEDKAGLASLTADLLNEGTETRTARQISEEIEFVGGSLSTAGGKDSMTASLTVLKKDIGLGMALLADVLMHPSFRDEEINRRKKIIKNSILQQQEDPGTVADKAFQKALYGTHPYGWPVEGTEESVEGISREDILGFYRQYYAPNNMIMAVVGDVDKEELRRLLQEAFLLWPRKNVPPLQLPPPRQHERTEVVTVDKELAQATIILGHGGIARDHPDYYAVTVMNYILGGGGFVSRMMDNIRDNLGLAYDVRSSFTAGKHAGSFEAALQTKNESANTAIAELQREMERMRAELVSDKELNDAKSYLTGSFPLRIDSNRKIANFITAVEMFNLGLDYVNEYPGLINVVTKEDVLRVARTYLHPDRYLLTVVGDQKKITLAR